MQQEKKDNNSNVVIIMYHYVRDLKNSRYPNIRGLDYNLFKEQIKFIKDKFNVITMEEMICSIYENYQLPKNSALLTFDDGYLDNFINVFPILKENNIQGSFFIPGRTFVEHKLLDVNKIHFILASTDENKLLKDIFDLLDYYRGNEYNLESNKELFNKLAVANRFDSKETIFIKRLLQNELEESLRNRIVDQLFKKNMGISEEIFARELYMNYEQIKCMKDNGMYIGLHGYNHEWLGRIEINKMKEDIEKGKNALSGIIDTNYMVMNYPYGSYNDETINYIKSIDCKLGLSTNVGICDIKLDNPFTLPRLDTNDLPPKSDNFRNYL